MYDIGKSLSKYHLFPITLKQLLLLDDDKLIIKMAEEDDYIIPLQAFKYRVCFGNAKYDSIVSCASSLILYENEYNQYGDMMWDNNMENENGKCLIEPCVYDDEDDDDCWFKRLQEMEWKKFVVCWNYNKCVRSRSHDLLAAPFIWYSGCKPLFDAIHENFKYE